MTRGRIISIGYLIDQLEAVKQHAGGGLIEIVVRDKTSGLTLGAETVTVDRNGLAVPVLCLYFSDDSDDGGEYRVSYYEPGLGWCNLNDPHPEGTVYRVFGTALAAAEACRERLDRSVRVYRCGAHGIKLIHETRRILEDGTIENLPEP